MAINHILDLLVAERDRLNAAIQALEEAPRCEGWVSQPLVARTRAVRLRGKLQLALGEL